MRKHNGAWNCTICEMQSKGKINVRRHIESKHTQGVALPCNMCGLICKTRHSLQEHKSKCNKLQARESGKSTKTSIIHFSVNNLDSIK